MSEPTGRPPAQLSTLRDQLDSVDRRVLELLAERMRIVGEVAHYKRNQKLEIRDPERERQVLEARRKLAIELGLDPGPVESIYRQIMLASRDYQASVGAAAVSAPSEVKRIAIVGGAGAMGRLLGAMFNALGHVIEVVDLDSPRPAAQVVAEADVVVIAVPIASTERVIRELGPHVRADGLLLDITSIKAVPLAAMLQSTQASVVGTHPMFGPGVQSLQGQRIILCKGRGEQWWKWLCDALRSRGLVITQAQPDEHDRAMALVQVLTHFQTQVFGLALARFGVALEDSLRFTSPAYLLELYVAARHFAQAAELYGPIEMLNAQTVAVTTAFRRAAEEVAEILRSRDQARFEAVFSEVRAFFGDFARVANEQSSFLIDRLTERSNG